jgi:hypothetical protein
MKKHGLTVHPVSPPTEEAWTTLLREEGYPVFVGPRISKKMFDTVRDLLNEYRRSEEFQTMAAEGQ